MNCTIGLLGGGQLGQMLCEAANSLGLKVIILDNGLSPAKQINAKVSHINGSFSDPDRIRELASRVDILTVETEHVDTFTLEDIAEMGVVKKSKDEKLSISKVKVQPSWRTIRTIQDKYLQKQHLISHGIQTVLARPIAPTPVDLEAFGQKFGFPFVLKSRKNAYDGRGNYVVKSKTLIENALDSLRGMDLYAEQWADFEMELSVMVVKVEDDINLQEHATIAYPVVETVHQDGICKLVYAPARCISDKVRQAAQELAKTAVGCLWGRGVFGVELFLLKDGNLLVNEIAPRPHNSGHYTIEACPTLSQYKSHLLSILGMMPKFADLVIPMLSPASIMLNILGGAETKSHEVLVERALTIPSAALHMYGKDSRPGRKIGHLTIVSDTMNQAEQTILPLLRLADSMRSERKPVQGSRTDSLIQSLPMAISSTASPLVAVTMGSDSDLAILKSGLSLLETLEISTFVTITSAHRTPKRMMDFASGAASKGFKVIIAAAGGAAHLPGMIAACTTLPVIGVPVKGSTLDGMDSLLSIVQMPRGVPVATVAINNSVNAALLAARILATSDEKIRFKLEEYTKQISEGVEEKARRLEDVGFDSY